MGLDWDLPAYLPATASRAIQPSKDAVDLRPREGNFWHALGVAHYRAGDWKAAIARLEQSIRLRKVGDASDWFFLAMSHWHLGNKEEARKLYDLAADWTEKHALHNPELVGFHAEAAALLGLPVSVRVLLEQARTHARSSRWEQAAAAYEQAAAAPGSEMGHVSFEHACVLLLADDRVGYRRMCAAMLDDQSPKPRGFLVARACTLAPEAVDELARAEKVGSAELAGNNRYWALTASAGLHYRAARFQQAADTLHQCLKHNPGWDGRLLNWLWLSLTCHRLGNQEEARQWLDQARAWLDRYGGEMPLRAEGKIGLHLHDWLEAHVLRREAEALIREAGRARKK